MLAIATYGVGALLYLYTVPTALTLGFFGAWFAWLLVLSIKEKRDALALLTKAYADYKVKQAGANETETNTKTQASPDPEQEKPQKIDTSKLDTLPFRTQKVVTRTPRRKGETASDYVNRTGKIV